MMDRHDIQAIRAQRLQNGIHFIREHRDVARDFGVRISDPHVFIVEDGKAGGELPQPVLDTKRRFDPLGLLNPGKVRAWLEGPP